MDYEDRQLVVIDLRERHVYCYRGSSVTMLSYSHSLDLQY